jgi:hypothetical protein
MYFHSTRSCDPAVHFFENELFFSEMSSLPTPSYSLSSVKGRKKQHSYIWTSIPKKIYLKAKKQKTDLEAGKQNKTEMQGKEFGS